ncbi:MAG: hypothetical protein AB7P99_11665 [Vicinamibacterales bacterium]
MTAAARRQAALLGILVLALAALLYLRREPQPPAGAAPAASNPATPAAAAPAAEPPVADVRLEALTGDRDDLGPAERNPFRFGGRQAPERQAARPAPEPRPQAAATVAPAGPPPPPPIPLKFIGVLEAPTRIGTVAILSDSRGNVFYGKEGDIIEGRYRVLKIGTESAEVAYADGRGRQTIRLSGQ